jgi:hypothetical protein
MDLCSVVTGNIYGFSSFGTFEELRRQVSIFFATHQKAVVVFSGISLNELGDGIFTKGIGVNFRSNVLFGDIL